MTTAAAEVRWCRSLADLERERGVVAWLLPFSESRMLFGPDLRPTLHDRRDIGARRGAEAERFFHRRSTLRHLVGHRFGQPADTVEVGYGRHGRPEVLQPARGVHCSVAARGKLAGYAVAGEPVGIDLEPLEPGDIPWAVLTTGEAANLRRLAEADQLRGFLRLWTVKEAYLKAHGAGLLEDPTKVEVAQDARSLLHRAHRVSLPASAIGHALVDGQPVVAACLSLPPLISPD